ncbi:MAG: Flp pilus assembly protein CpaB [Rickettsiales bacterium]|nr:Flp pilus assembly protein CpaB [Rickettsiales bacterium]
MRLIGIVIALVLAVGAAFIVFSLSKPEPGAPTAQIMPQTPVADTSKAVDVLVAAHSIPIGEVIKAEMISRQPWPSHLVINGFVTAGGQSNSIVGMVTRSTFQEGEPIILSKLSNPSDPNFLAAALEPGYKVATIQVDNISAVAGFLFPGDYVDVLITHEIPSDDETRRTAANDKRDSYTELLLTNVKVLAVDDRSTAGQTQPEGAQKRPPSSVSLEVQLEQAQKLRLAQETGYVSLALRSLKDKDVDDSAAPTGVADLTHTVVAKKTTSEEAETNPVKVIRGTETKDVSGVQSQNGALLGQGLSASALQASPK